MEYLQLNAEADAARVRSRTDAEVADLKTKIVGLEVNLEKVQKCVPLTDENSDRIKANKNHLQDLKTAHHEYSTELSALTARLERAEDRAKDAETELKVAQQKAIKVSDPFWSVLVKLLCLVYGS